MMDGGVRRKLVKRIESSTYLFRTTETHLIRTHGMSEWTSFSRMPKQFARWFFGIYYTQTWIMCTTHTSKQPHNREAYERQCKEVVRSKRRKNRAKRRSENYEKKKKQADTFAAFFTLRLLHDGTHRSDGVLRCRMQNRHQHRSTVVGDTAKAITVDKFGSRVHFGTSAQLPSQHCDDIWIFHHRVMISVGCVRFKEVKEKWSHKKF